jgi:plasmid stability protein
MEPREGATMYSMTVKNIPEDIYKRLKHSAKVNRRSINSEIIVIIEKAVQSKKIVSEDFLVRARQIREKTADYKITDDEFTQEKKAGRL